MKQNKTCGNCSNFIRIKPWGGSRNGLCNVYDYNCKTDSSYAKKCKGYKGKKYNRKEAEFNFNLENMQEAINSPVTIRITGGMSDEEILKVLED